MKNLIFLVVFVLQMMILVSVKVTPIGKAKMMPLLKVGGYGSATSTHEKKFLSLRGGAAIGGFGLSDLLKLNGFVAVAYGLSGFFLPNRFFPLIGFKYDDSFEFFGRVLAVFSAAFGYSNWHLSQSIEQGKAAWFVWTAITANLLDQSRKGNINWNAPFAKVNGILWGLATLAYSFLIFA